MDMKILVFGPSCKALSCYKSTSEIECIKSCLFVPFSERVKNLSMNQQLLVLPLNIILHPLRMAPVRSFFWRAAKEFWGILLILANIKEVFLLIPLFNKKSVHH